jgi:hypothetical protein
MAFYISCKFTTGENFIFSSVNETKDFYQYNTNFISSIEFKDYHGIEHIIMPKYSDGIFGFYSNLKFNTSFPNNIMIYCNIVYTNDNITELLHFLNVNNFEAYDLANMKNAYCEEELWEYLNDEEFRYNEERAIIIEELQKHLYFA